MVDFPCKCHPKRKRSYSNHPFSGATLPKTNIAMENPPFWWYLQGNMGVFMGYVSFREGTWRKKTIWKLARTNIIWLLVGLAGYMMLFANDDPQFGLCMKFLSSWMCMNASACFSFTLYHLATVRSLFNKRQTKAANSMWCLSPECSYTLSTNGFSHLNFGKTYGWYAAHKYCLRRSISLHSKPLDIYIYIFDILSKWWESVYHSVKI